MNLIFFEPLPEMLPQDCGFCQKPVLIPADGVVVQRNYPGGGNAIVHESCLDQMLEREGVTQNLHEVN
jgi:hypothetical protein